jgi:hypothetical protein
VVDGQFAAAGRYGSGANANAFNTALTNQAGQLGYQNFSDSLNRQVNAAGQLSQNNTNSTNAALAALGLVPGLSTAAADAGSNLYGGATAPLTTFANIISMLGSGGGTTTGTQNSSTTGKTSGTGLGFSLSAKDLGL